MNNQKPLASNIALQKFLAESSELRPLDFAFLEERVYASELSSQELARFERLIDLVRQKQKRDPFYEPLFNRLLHLYVLNGSRLGLLQRIERRLRGLVEGQNSFLLISGISGIGKTSLVLAFQDRIERLGVKFLSVRCSEQCSAAFGLWQEFVMRSQAAGLPAVTLPAAQLPAPIGSGPEARSPHQLYTALLSWLQDCARQQPLFVLLDDLHWADQDSLELLDYLSGQPDLQPVMFAVTYRSEEVHLGHEFYQFIPRLLRNRSAEALALASLTRPDIERLITARIGPADPTLVDYLFEQAEGHPLFILILLADLAAQNLLPRSPAGAWLPPGQHVQVPGLLRQLILQQVQSLGQPAARLLEAAAIVGETWPLGLCEDLLAMPEGDLLAAMEAALQAGLIELEDERSETYAFKHGLIRQVLYTNQPTRIRNRLHNRLAGLLAEKQPGGLFEIAHHYYEAGSWQQAAEFSQAASEQASHLLANHSALEWCQKALAAAEQAPDTGLVFELHRRLGRIYMALGQRDQSEAAFERMRNLAQRSGDLLALGTALADLAHSRLRRFQPDLAEQTLREALQIAHTCANPQLQAEVDYCLGALKIARGELAEAGVFLSQATRPGGAASGSDALFEALRLEAYYAIWTGRYAAAEQTARRALEEAGKTRDPLAVVGAYQNLAFAQIESGQFLQAHETLTRTLQAITDSGTHHHQEPRLLNLLGYLHLELGDPQAALIWDQKALDAILDAQPQSMEMRRYCLLNQATDYLHLGDLAAVAETLHRFGQVQVGADFVQFRYHNRLQLLLSEFSLHQKNYTQAAAMAQEARLLALEKGMTKNVARSHWLEGQAQAGVVHPGVNHPGVIKAALNHFEMAASLADQIQHGTLRWKTRLSQAGLLKSAGLPAAEVLGQARKLFDQTLASLAGSPFTEVVQRSAWAEELRRLEQPAANARAALYPAGLTAREVEILRLVAEGASDRQVAEILHLSVRTVTTHMTHIFNKTGLENRTAASAFARQHGLLG